MQKYQEPFLTQTGDAAGYVSVLVQEYPGLATATIYSDDGVTPKANPMTTDGLGNAPFYAANGRYQLTISGSKVVTTTKTDIQLFDPADGTASSDIGFTPAGTGAVATTVQGKLRAFVSVLDYAANGVSGVAVDPTGVVDSTLGIQAALNYANTRGGGIVYVPTGTYKITAPLTMYSGTRLIGDGKSVSIIEKTTSTTVATSLTANLVVLDLTPIGANANCILYIYAPVRALDCEIAHLTLRSNGTHATTSPVKYGIVGVGMSESTIHDINVECVTSASFVMPVFFLSTITNFTSYRCGQGISLENGTSNTIESNYSTQCQKYGYFIRDMKYTSFAGNACDSLNDVSLATDYTDRTINSICYNWSACYGMSMENNGAEGCYGTQIKVDSCKAFQVENNTIISPCSSYTGASQVAIFYNSTLSQGVNFENNFVFRNGVTALQGAAVAGQHHDFYSDVASANSGFRFLNNWLCNTKYDAPSVIFGNNVPVYVNPAFQGAQLSGEFTPTLTLLNATGVTITYGANNKGRYSIVNGFMHVDLYLDIASVTFTNTTNIYPQIGGLPLSNSAVNRGNLQIDYSANVTWASTEPYYLAIDSGFTYGLVRNKTLTVALGAGATPSFVTGSTNVFFHIAGDIFVGDVVNIV